MKELSGEEKGNWNIQSLFPDADPHQAGGKVLEYFKRVGGGKPLSQMPAWNFLTVWPDKGKREHIPVILKQKNPTNLSECRSIHCTPFFSKVLENVVLDKRFVARSRAFWQDEEMWRRTHEKRAMGLVR